LRYIGIRVGFHIPCSFACKETIAVGQQRMDLMRAKNEGSAKLLVSLLSMPISWDCYHGAAIVRTPIFYIITSSCPSINRYVVEVPGTFIPQEATNEISGTI
jgi:hypothetical protein